MGYKLAYEDVEMWAEFATSPMKFKNALAQVHRLMKNPRKVTAQHIEEFNKRYKIEWLADDSIEVTPL